MKSALRLGLGLIKIHQVHVTAIENLRLHIVAEKGMICKSWPTIQTCTTGYADQDGCHSAAWKHQQP